MNMNLVKESVSVNPLCYDDDHEKGRIRLSTGLMEKLQIGPRDGVYVTIPSLNNTVFLCQAWPWPMQFVDSTIVSFDPLIVSKSKAKSQSQSQSQNKHFSERLKYLGSDSEFIDGSIHVAAAKSSIFDAKSIVIEFHPYDHSSKNQLPFDDGIDLKTKLLDHLKRSLYGLLIREGTYIHFDYYLLGKFFVKVTMPSSGAFVRISSMTQIDLIFPDDPVRKCDIDFDNNSDSSNPDSDEDEDDGIVGKAIKRVFEELCRLIMLPIKHCDLLEQCSFVPPKGILLKGPSGTGKTLLVHTIARKTRAKLFVVNGEQIFSSFMGESEEKLRQVFVEASEFVNKEKSKKIIKGSTPSKGSKVSEVRPCIIFIDDIDALCPRRNENDNNEARIVGQLLTLMDGLTTSSSSNSNVFIICATNQPNNIDPALRRPGRLDREIEIPVPMLEDRLKILEYHTRNLVLDPMVDLKMIAQSCVGYTGADVSSFCRETMVNAIRRVRKVIVDASKEERNQNLSFSNVLESMRTQITVCENDFSEALKTITPSHLRTNFSSSSPSIIVNFSELGGMESAISIIRDAVELPLKHPVAFSRIGLSPKRGVLLLGPPGCGKTKLVQALASQTGFSYFVVSGAALYSQYLGDSEAYLRNVFKKARLAPPAIVFLDELDTLVGKRGMESNGDVSERILSTILNEMDGVEQLTDIVVIAASNRQDMLDSALLRPGRFDVIIKMKLPDFHGRIDILKIYTKTMPLEANFDLELISNNTKGFSGADLENLCREAALLALRDDINSTQVQLEHFLNAIKAIHPLQIKPD